MALIQCHECNREISDSATACPGCGAPVQTQQHKKKNRAPYTDQEVAVLLSKKKRTSHIVHLLLSIVTGGLWIIVWVLIAASNGSVNVGIDKKIAKGKKL